jgi:hypothetical protein
MMMPTKATIIHLDSTTTTTTTTTTITTTDGNYVNNNNNISMNGNTKLLTISHIVHSE